ncbi:PAS domain-containing protein [Sphingomonas sp.]|uniref:PAS domain-containing protein n=1 Tax=Sphingomonas sp. TaxID=28214 RepID=UPI0028A696D3|nr:PAS domain-containing protein [Sphingomonas sp.]
MAEARAESFIDGLLRFDGALGRMVAQHDWAQTAIGPIQGWPESLKTTVGIILLSPLPMALLWGEDGVMVYNDAYAVLAGGRHPALLGMRVREAWPEIADFNDNVMRVGLAGGRLAYRDQPLTLYRHGLAEQMFMNLDYSPVLGENGRPAGILAVAVETTEHVAAKRTIETERDRATEILESISDAFYAVDRDWRFTYVNHKAAEWLGRPAAELLGKHCWTEFPQAVGGEAWEAHLRAMRDRATAQFEMLSRILQRWVGVDIHPTASGGLSVYFRDIGDQKRAEERVRESEGRYRQIVEGAEDFAITTVDEQGRVASWNSGAARITGFDEHDIVGKPGSALFTPEDCAAGAPEDELNRTKADGRSLNERWHLRKDGSRFWGSGMTMRLDQPGGGYLKIFRDRTAEHVAEARLRRRSEQLQGLAETAHAVTRAQTLEETLDEVTRAARRIVGTHQAVVSLTRSDDWSQVIPHVHLSDGYADWRGYATPADGSGIYAMVCETNRPMRLTQAELVAHPRWRGFGTHAKEHPPMRGWLAVPLVGRDGRNLGLLQLSDKEDGSEFDESDEAITVQLARQAADGIERVTAQAALRDSQARQAFLLALSDTLRALKSPVDIASAAAQQIAEQYGLSRVFYAEFFGSLMKVERDHTRGVDSIVGEHELAAFGEPLLRAYHESPVVRIDDVRTDPRLSDDARGGLLARQVGAYLDVILFEDEHWVSVLAMQCTTARSWSPAEEELFREIGERVKAAIERAAAEDQLRELNETLERRVAEALAERKLLADLVEGTDAFVQVVDHDFRWLAINRAAADEFARIYGMRPRVGDSMLDLLAARPEHHAAVQPTWRRALAGEEFTEIAEFGDSNHDRRFYEMKHNVLRDAHGVHIGAYQFAYDVTARIAEQRRLAEAEEALRQSQKMEAMGQLTGGVAHDFNNLLTPIVGSLDMLQRRGIGTEREQRLIAGAAQSAERARTLVQRLLAFARRQPLQPVAVDVAKLVQGMGDLVSSTTGPQIEVILEASDSLPAAKADPNQLEMALLNLAVNARDAMPGGGLLRISAAAETIGRGHRSGLKPGTYVKLAVADTGAGMDDATLARAIEPFFSTKGVGKGTGLGLSMVHGLASQLGGGLTIHSQLGRGTTIELWLPQSAEMRMAAEQPIEHPLAPVARGIALLVDDEELVRLSTADMLTEIGYAVIEAASGEEAMQIVTNGVGFDILLTDHLMPGITGTDLARLVRMARPEVPALLVSGYAETDGVDPDLPRLIKPFRKDELASSLAHLPGYA